MNTTTLSALSFLLLAPFASAADQKPASPPPRGEADIKTVAQPTPGKAAQSEVIEPAAVPVAATPPKDDLPEVLRGVSPDGMTERVHFDRPGDGNLWVRGADYKARFGNDAVEFIPALGSDAPRNFPVRFELESVHVGERELALERDVEPALDGRIVSYDRGGVVEHYVVELGSIEQRFRLERPVSGAAGDLVIRVDVESELDALDSAAGFRFAGEFGGVQYGRAVTFDATGFSVASPTRLVEGDIEIRVPASYLASASYPLTIDPLVNSFTIDNQSTRKGAPDVAFDESHQIYAVTWEVWFSSSDRDVWVQTHDTLGGTHAGSGAYIDATSHDWRFPRIANNNLANQFLVVAVEGTSPNTVISGRTREAANIQMGNQLQISGSEAGSKSFADVGGDPVLAGPTYYCVSWNRQLSTSDYDIHAKLVSSSGSLASGLIAVDNSSGTVDYAPQISKGNGHAPFSTQAWTIVWARYYSSSDTDIWGAQLSWNGNFLQTTYPIDLTVTSHGGPDVSTVLDATSGERPYMVAYVGNNDIHGRVLRGRTSISNTYNLTGLEASGFQGQTQYGPCAESDGSTFIVTYSELYGSSTTDWDAYVAEFDYSNGVIRCTDSHRNMAFNSTAELGTNMTSRRTAGGYWQGLMSVWHDIGGSTYRIEGATLYSESFGNTFCTSLPHSAGGVAHLNATGSRSIGEDSLVLRVVDAPPQKAGLFFSGTNQVNFPFGDGRRCVNGGIKRFPVIQTNSGGAAFLAVDMDASYAAGIHSGSSGVNYQFWFRDPQGGPAGFNYSDGLNIQHTP